MQAVDEVDEVAVTLCFLGCLYFMTELTPVAEMDVPWMLEMSFLAASIAWHVVMAISKVKLRCLSKSLTVSASMKKLITAAWTGRSVNQDKLFRALLQYRNTPSRRDGQSPAQKLYGHPIQDTLPAHRRSFAPEWQRHSLDTEESLKISEEYYDQHAHKLPDLHVGSHVAIQNTSSKLWDIYGIITAIAPHRRYFVRTQSGNILVRNRRFLRKRIATSVHAPGPIDIVSQDTVPDTLPAPQRPARQRRPPERLIEDEHWN